jgi:hypothetical protein
MHPVVAIHGRLASARLPSLSGPGRLPILWLLDTSLPPSLGGLPRLRGAAENNGIGSTNGASGHVDRSNTL